MTQIGPYTPPQATWGVGVCGMVATPSGGGDPDDYRRVENHVTGELQGLHMKHDAVYHPSSKGAILSIDYSEDGVMFYGFAQGQASGLLLLQNCAH